VLLFRHSFSGSQQFLATEDNEENEDFDLTAEKRAEPLHTNSTNSHQSLRQNKFNLDDHFDRPSLFMAMKGTIQPQQHNENNKPAPRIVAIDR
jgi:hypothetical protein